jgi:hypothetical protein
LGDRGWLFGHSIAEELVLISITTPKPKHE